MGFEAWWSGFRRTGSIDPVRLGWTRERVIELFGEPERRSARKHPAAPDILVWGGVEFHFDGGAEGGLRLIYRDDEEGVVELCIGGRLYEKP